MSILKTLDLEVDLATMKRRLDLLEARFLGAVDDLGGPQPLFTLYTHLIFDGIQPSKETAAMMQSCSLLLTPRNLLDLTRLTGDMFPWRPFLAALDLLEATGHSVGDSVLWVEACALDLMHAQGLGALRIADVIKSPVGPLHELRRFALSK